MDYQKVSARVLARLKVMYPQFANQVLNDNEMMALAVDEWAKSLQGIPIEKIELGLEKVRRSGNEFAPSLPKFVQYCGGRAKPWWETIEGIEHRAKELGVEWQPRVDLFRLEVLAKARKAGENIPLAHDEKPKETLPDGVKKLAQSVKVC